MFVIVRFLFFCFQCFSSQECLFRRATDFLDLEKVIFGQVYIKLSSKIITTFTKQKSIKSKSKALHQIHKNLDENQSVLEESLKKQGEIKEQTIEYNKLAKQLEIESK